MNKLFTKIVGAALGLTMAIGVGVAVASNSKEASPVHAADTTISWTATSGALGSAISKQGDTATGSIALAPTSGTSYTMSYTRTLVALASGKSDNVSWQGSTWIQLGSNNASQSVVFTASSIPGTIKSVSIQAATAGTHTYTIDVGGTKYANALSLTTYSNTASATNPSPEDTTKTATGSSSGALTITLTAGTRKALLIRSISVTYATVSNIDVTFNANGHGTAPAIQTIQSGGKATDPGAPTGTTTGWTFGGWYENSSCTGSAWNFNTTISANKTLWAKWTATTYSISYTLNGGTHGNTHPTSGTYDTAFSVSAPTKTGYTFTGWTVTSGLNTSTAKWGTTSSPSTAISSSSTLCVNGTNAVYFKNINAASTAVTLTANWSINSYTVGGTISNGSLSSTANVNYNDALDIEIVPDTANNYTYPSSIDSVTMGGAAYAGYTYDSTDGSFYIEHVTGNVVINAACVSTSATERFFDYHLTNCSIENAPESMYDTEMKLLQIVADDHYKFPSSITVAGISTENWEYDADEGTILINEPDGDIDITVTCVAKAQNIITIGTLTGVTQKSGDPTTVEEGDIVTLTFIASSGYGLPTSSGITVTGVDSQSWSWDQNSGELEILGGTSNITVSVAATQRDLTDGSLTLGTKKDSYTTGDDFELPSTVTANFNLAPSTVNVKNDVVVSGPVVINSNKYIVTGSGTITLTYTYEPTGSTQSASYAITATPITPSSAEYRKVTSISAGTYLMVYEEGGYAMSTTQGSNNRDSVSVTINDSKITSAPATAQVLTVSQTTIDNKTGWQFYTGSGYLYAASSSNNYLRTQTTNNANGLFTANFSGGDVTLTAQGSYTRNIIRFNTASDQLKFSCYASTSGLPVVQLYKYYPAVEPELKWITAEVKSGTYYQGNSVTASDFTVTAHYNDGETSTLSSGVTVTNGYLANIGNNEVTLTYSGKSCKVNVKAVEQTAEYTGLSWTQGEYTVIDGQNIDFSKFGTVTAEYDDGEEYATKAISSCTVATYTKSGDVYTKVADLSDGATITSSSHGKYLGVTYTETNTFTAYSSAPIYVVESLQPIKRKVQQLVFDTQATDSNPIAIGDVIEFANVEALRELAGISTTSTKYGIAETYVSEPTGAYPLEVEQGSTAGTFSFKNGDLYLAWVSGNSLTTSVDKDASSSWTIDYNEDGIVITNVSDTTREIRYNDNNGSGQRFACYDNTKSSLPLIQVYKGETKWVPYGDSIANTNAVVQKAVLEFAEHFNDKMQCVNGGTTTNVQSKWSTLSSDFTTAMSGFTGDDLAHFKALFAYADSVEGGDTLQDMLARYDYIIAKYKLSNDFLHVGADRGAVQYARITPLNIVVNNGNTVAIIVIISMISISAIGGYFFLRKRKEEI